MSSTDPVGLKLLDHQIKLELLLCSKVVSFVCAHSRNGNHLDGVPVTDIVLSLHIDFASHFLHHAFAETESKVCSLVNDGKLLWFFEVDKKIFFIVDAAAIVNDLNLEVQVLVVIFELIIELLNMVIFLFCNMVNCSPIFHHMHEVLSILRRVSSDHVVLTLLQLEVESKRV